MQRAYARIDDQSVAYTGPAADPALQRAAGQNYTLVGIASEGVWRKASTALVELMGQDRPIEMFVPLIALSLTALNIP
ncbi:MAG TPA: hypothetical protein VN924_20565 [Bryobacteraceae bacterium]|nr:hypothetical protein [Bryobacteraceae bacterium]